MCSQLCFYCTLYLDVVLLFHCILQCIEILAGPYTCLNGQQIPMNLFLGFLLWLIVKHYPLVFHSIVHTLLSPPPLNTYLTRYMVNEYLCSVFSGENGSMDSENKYVQYPDNLNLKGQIIVLIMSPLSIGADLIWSWCEGIIGAMSLLLETCPELLSCVDKS